MKTTRGRRLSVVDLFSGAGGFSLGFHAAGFRIGLSADHDPSASETFEQNFRLLQADDPPIVLGGDEGDVSPLDFDSFASPDVLIGGPPCQAYSRVGRAKLASLSEEPESDPRNSLYLSFIDAVRAWEPRAIVVENVPGMLTLGGRNVADDIAADLADCGYDLRYTLVNAAWYGVPQLRERLIFIGIRLDLQRSPEFPVPTHQASSLPGYVHRNEPTPLSFEFVEDRREYIDTRAGSQPAVTVSEAIGDLPRVDDHLTPDGTRRPRDFRTGRKYTGEPATEFSKLMRSWPGLPEPLELDDHEVRRTPRDFETFRRMRPGDRYPQAVKIAWQRVAERISALRESGQDVPADSDQYRRIVRSCVPPYGGTLVESDDPSWQKDFPDRWRKLIPDQPSWTVPAHLSKDSYSHIHYDCSQARMISVREAARLQSFPDGYRFVGNMGDCFRQIGNAVPPLLSRSIALSIRAILE